MGFINQLITGGHHPVVLAIENTGSNTKNGDSAIKSGALTLSIFFSICFKPHSSTQLDCSLKIHKSNQRTGRTKHAIYTNKTTINSHVKNNVLFIQYHTISYVHTGQSHLIRLDLRSILASAIEIPDGLGTDLQTATELLLLTVNGWQPGHMCHYIHYGHLSHAVGILMMDLWIPYFTDWWPSTNMDIPSIFWRCISTKLC